MLVEFTVGNFRSFKENVTFRMVAAKLTAKNKELDANNVFTVDEHLNLLTSAAIYGANASGKSNLIAALRFMRNLVINSSKESQAEERIPVENFRLSTATENEPSFFEVVFYLENRRYRYGFTVNTERILSEWLFYVPTSREARLFERAAEGIHPTSTFKEARSGLVALTRDNALFLSVVAQFNGEISQKIIGWFRNLTINSGLNDRSRMFTMRSFEKSQEWDEIVKFVKGLDLGISNIDVERVPVPYRTPLAGFEADARAMTRTVIKTLHHKYDEEGTPIAWEAFDLDQHESDGTRKLFSFAWPLINTLKHGKVLIVDELDARLHPLLTCAIINLFNSPDTNPKHGQLIFTTHDTNLLSNKIFRRDQIWFTEKDRRGATRLYSLAEFKVRNDASFEKDYINGRYGAVPFVGDLARMIGEDELEQA